MNNISKAFVFDFDDTIAKTKCKINVYEGEELVDKITPEGLPELGLVEVATTNYGGHPPEFWAEQLTDKICGVSDDNEEHIKAQARAYRNLIYKVCLIYIKNAIKSYKATLIQELSKGGSEDLAKIIKGI